MGVFSPKNADVLRLRAGPPAAALLAFWMTLGTPDQGTWPVASQRWLAKSSPTQVSALLGFLLYGRGRCLQ